jgi:Asp-tRNA(Asn)/Glu-tRNA(Gln) amidotransferase A subunit family amidase
VAKSLAVKRGEHDFPPLFGVPISVKDCIGMKGSLSTGGLQCRTREDLRFKEDSLIVAIVRKAGALPMVRGNVSQTMMMPESVNNIWGRTLNPWDLNRTSGGSSGGDAALVAMKCVPLAIGSDVAGSIRIPATFCGIVGFKPTTHRLSLKGCMRPKKVRRAKNDRPQNMML